VKRGHAKAAVRDGSNNFECGIRIDQRSVVEISQATMASGIFSRPLTQEPYSNGPTDTKVSAGSISTSCDWSLPLCSSYWEGTPDAHPNPPRIMGTDQCHGVMRLDSLRDVGGLRDHPSLEDAAYPVAGDLLQGPLACYRGVPTLVKGQAGGFTGGRHHVGGPLGDLAHRRCSVGVRICDLHLQAEGIEYAL